MEQRQRRITGLVAVALPEDQRSHAAGFGAVEVLIAAATFAIVAFVLVGLVHEYSLTSQSLTAKQHSHLDIARLLDAWQTDSASSEAVFIPDADVLGSDNTAKPHEIDFYTKDAANRPYFWAYYFDASAHTMQRYDYGTPGSAAQKDGNAYANITQFTPSLHALSEISNPASPIYAPVFGPAADYDVALGFAKVVGGTHIVHIDLRTPYETVPAELEAGGAPSGFTVVLNYTPAPKPTPKLALATWPIAVAYGLNNTDVADSGKLPMPFDIAAAINALFGGGVARAAGCHAIAYTNAAMTQIDRNDTSFQASLGISTDANGCYGGEVVAYEPSGAVASYQIQNGTCGSNLIFVGWTPTSGVGVQVAQTVRGGPSPTSICNVDLSDGSATVASLGRGIVDAAIYSCSGPFMISASGQAYCNWHLLFQSGYAGTVSGGANSDGWFAQPASANPPVVDCRVPPDGSGGGGCQTIPNGAIEYCYNTQQNTTNLTLTAAQGNSTGFGCANIGNPHDWPVLRCINPPGNPRYCLGQTAAATPRTPRLT